MTSEREETVALVGLGSLGSTIAARLGAGGVDLLLHDVDRERVGEVAAATGGRGVDELADLREASLVICLLPTTAVVEEVVRGDGGLFDVLEGGALVLDMGSSDPRSTIKLAGAGAANGIEYADAPVSGGVKRAATGELTIMFGGSDAQLRRARPLLETVGSTIIAVGAVGSAHAAKALNNLLSAIGLASALEVLEVARRFGLDPNTMLEILNRSTGQNNATTTKIDQFVLSQTFASGFALRLMLKDVTTALAVAREVDAPTPLGDACQGLWQAAAEQLPPDADQTSIASLLLAQPELAG